MRTICQLKPKELGKIEKAIRQDKRAEVKLRAGIIRLLHLLLNQHKTLLACLFQSQAGQLGELISAVYDHRSKPVNIYLLKLL